MGARSKLAPPPSSNSVSKRTRPEQLQGTETFGRWKRLASLRLFWAVFWTTREENTTIRPVAGYGAGKQPGQTERNQ